MSASSKCPHPGIVFSIEPQSSDEYAGRVFVRMSAQCEHCNTRFRFLGIPNAPDPDAPAVNRSATDVLLPMIEVPA